MLESKKIKSGVLIWVKNKSNRQQIGHNKEHGKAEWFAKKGYAGQLIEDLKLRNTLKDKLYHAGISRIEIERVGEKVRVLIYAARPGIIIGKKEQRLIN